MLFFTALAGYIYNYLLPSGRVSSTARAVASVLCVAAVCIPLFGLLRGDIRGEGLFFAASEPDPVLEPYAYYAEIASETVKDKVSRIVKLYTDHEFSVETDIHIGEDMCIDIKQVSVIFRQYPDEPEELSLAVEKELGIVPRFVLKEDENE